LRQQLRLALVDEVQGPLAVVLEIYLAPLGLGLALEPQLVD
jgi:hypothetical protein